MLAFKSSASFNVSSLTPGLIFGEILISCSSRKTLLPSITAWSPSLHRGIIGFCIISKTTFVGSDDSDRNWYQ
ncbi:hypothetical protein MtrunA17_Chr7g0235911 [Medicago truncatula]|uniref:Uncharacterized protein n=1 Tax=Medicago truncatula TaxID=3880 RepID=A0A396H4G3_MEDTR|nr:hypothetical protein MtrunA17_Chr7g0235911 [Medicago truncatula]